LQSSRRVVDLNAKWVYNGISADSFLNWSGIVPDSLLKLGFEIARSNPTVTSGENPISEWIETLVETTDPIPWKSKGMRSVAGGLSEWFDGFDMGPLLKDLSADGYNGRNRMPGTLQKAIEYAGRLVMAARAIDDVSLVEEAKRANFLSHLVNLGGIYAPLASTQAYKSSDLFLENIWNNEAALGLNNLKIFLSNSPSATRTISYVQKTFSTLVENGTEKKNLEDSDYLLSTLLFARDYSISRMNGALGSDDRSFMSKIWLNLNANDQKEASTHYTKFLSWNKLQNDTIPPVQLAGDSLGDWTQEFDCLVTSSSTVESIAAIACPPEPTEEQRKQLERIFANSAYKNRLLLKSGSRGCIQGILPWHLGVATGSQADLYMTQVSGVTFDYYVLAPSGKDKFFDGITPRTRNLWEAKHGYRYLKYDTQRWLDVIGDMDREAAYSKQVANECKFTLTYAFSESVIADFFKERWSGMSQFPVDVRWINYTGPKNVPVR
jgi:hypothetical protein